MSTSLLTIETGSRSAEPRDTAKANVHSHRLILYTFTSSSSAVKQSSLSRRRNFSININEKRYSNINRSRNIYNEIIFAYYLEYCCGITSNRYTTNELTICSRTLLWKICSRKSASSSSIVFFYDILFYLFIDFSFVSLALRLHFIFKN